MKGEHERIYVPGKKSEPTFSNKGKQNKVCRNEVVLLAVQRFINDARFLMKNNNDSFLLKLKLEYSSLFRYTVRVEQRAEWTKKKK